MTQVMDVVHCNNLEDSDATLCGILFASILRMTDREDAVDCPDCVRILQGDRRTDPEICICAAVIDPINGEVVRCHRHAGGMSMIWKRHEPSPRIRDEHGGFITSRNRFVSREEGLLLQTLAGIPSACEGRGYLSTQLTSEDLYAGTY